MTKLSKSHSMERRSLLATSAGGAIAAMTLAATPIAVGAERSTHVHASNGQKMSEDRIVAKDGTRIYYKDWGSGKPVVLSHGWPLDADAWDAQMLFLVNKGYRVIAHDRRGHGRSDQPASGNDVDTYADDLAAVIDALDLKGAMLVGHSMGGGEVVRYVARHGLSRVSKIVLISAVVPNMVKSEANPEGLPESAFDGIRNNLAGTRTGFYKNLALPFYGFNRPDAKVDQAVIEEFWREGMAGSILSQYACVKQFEVEYTADVMKVDVPTLILHGDDDQLVPVDVAGRMSAKLIRNATLKVYPGAPHGMCTTHADRVNADLLAFLQS